MSARNKHAAKVARRAERERKAEHAAGTHHAANAGLVVGGLLAFTGARLRRLTNRSERRR